MLYPQAPKHDKASNTLAPFPNIGYDICLLDRVVRELEVCSIDHWMRSSTCGTLGVLYTNCLNGLSSGFQVHAYSKKQGGSKAMPLHSICTQGFLTRKRLTHIMGRNGVLDFCDLGVQFERIARKRARPFNTQSTKSKKEPETQVTSLKKGPISIFPYG
jgi:hypothetical protein